MNSLKKIIAIILIAALTVTIVPLGESKASAEEQANAENQSGQNEGDVENQGSEIEEEITAIQKHQKEVVDEARNLDVPEAFIRSNFAERYENDLLGSPVTELEENEEQPSFNFKVVNAKAGNTGLEVTGVDTGVLSRTVFDLGEFDFGDLKAGNMIYNMLAKRNLKGKAYVYFKDTTKEFATINIKRCADDDWEATQNRAVDVRNVDLSGKGHIYLKFVADSALDDDGNIKPISGVKGNLYFESMFFTEGSTPVLDFDLDNEVNSIEKINGSEKHTITGYGNMNVKIPQGYQSEYTEDKLQDETYELEYIRGRGNSTWLVDKKPYKVKLDKKANLFGMGKSKHWVLLANYYDYSLLRNKMTFYLAEKMGMKFVPKSVSVDVVISGEYYGSYQLCQQVRIEKSSVDIDDLEDEQATSGDKLTGGYLMSMGASWLTEGEEELVQYFDSEAGTFKIEKPEYDADYSQEAIEAQKNYLVNYFNEIEAAVRATNKDYDFDDSENQDYPLTKPEDGKTWRDYMDEQSYIDYYLLQELSKNGDAYSSGSTYLYKERNGKLYWGPVWDFDFVAWSAYTTKNNEDNKLEEFAMRGVCPWFAYLLTYDSNFKDKVIERWRVLSQILEEAIADDGFIDKSKKDLYYSALANYQVRGSYLMQDISYWDDEMDLVDDEGNPYTLNYGNEIDRLKNYIKTAKDWLDENIEKIDENMTEQYDPVTFYVDGEVYAKVEGTESGTFDMSKLPKAPEKEGYIFKGWYYTDEEGYEGKINDEVFLYYYDDLDSIWKAYPIVAKYIKEEDYKKIQSISFSNDTLYVPMYEDDSIEYENDPEVKVFSNQYLDLKKYVSVKPLEADKDDLKWTFSQDETELGEMAYVNSQNILEVFGIGEGYATCSFGDKTAKIKIVAFDAAVQEKVSPTSFDVEKTISLKAGSYGDVKFGFDKKEYVSFEEYENVYFKSSDESVVRVDENGSLYAQGSGTADICTIWNNDGIFEIKVSKITVGGSSADSQAEQNSSANTNKNTAPTNNKNTNTTTAKKTASPAKTTKPAKSVIKKVYAKKKKSKKLKLKLKKIKNAKGYEVRIYKNKKNAKKNKKAIVKKSIKKVKVTISSKKIKNKKKLYIKVRAYTLKGKTKVYGKWSKLKNVKIK